MFLAKNFTLLLIFCTDNSVAVQTVDHSCRKYWIYDRDSVNPGGLNSTFPNLILLKDPQRIVKNQPDTSDGMFCMLVGYISHVHLGKRSQKVFEKGRTLQKPFRPIGFLHYQ